MDAILVTIGTVSVALINMVGSVLILWIRAHYRWRNGTHKRKRLPGPPSPPSPA